MAVKAVRNAIALKKEIIWNKKQYLRSWGCSQGLYLYSIFVHVHCTRVSAYKAKVIAFYNLSGGYLEAQAVIWFANRAPHLTARTPILLTVGKPQFLRRFTSNRESCKI